MVAPGVDYHWYRQNPDGTRSHKPGTQPVRDVDASNVVITNPMTADRNYPKVNYSDWGGFFGVPKGGNEGVTMMSRWLRFGSMPFLAIALCFYGCKESKKNTVPPPPTGKTTTSAPTMEKRKLNLKEFHLQREISKEGLVREMGPPDDIVGFGVQYVLYKLDDDTELWLYFDQKDFAHLETASVVTRDQYGKVQSRRTVFP